MFDSKLTKHPQLFFGVFNGITFEIIINNEI